MIDPLSSPHAAAVGSTLASFEWNLKTTSSAKAKLEPVEIGLLGESKPSTLASESGQDGRIPLDWETGKVYGEAQNMARLLKETPANVRSLPRELLNFENGNEQQVAETAHFLPLVQRMTPTIFCDFAKEKFEGIANVTIEAHDLAWAEERKMGSFISVSRGSDEPLRFLELHYKGAKDKNEKPIAFVGKGITFDSGGIVSPRCIRRRLPCDSGLTTCVVASL